MGRSRRSENVPEWRDQVEQRLKEWKKPHKWLAKKVSASPAAITGILSGKTSTSKFLKPISDVLRVPEPYRGPELSGEYSFDGKPESGEKLAVALAVLSMRKTVSDLANALDEYAACVVAGDWERARDDIFPTIDELVHQLDPREHRIVWRHHLGWTGAEEKKRKRNEIRQAALSR